MTQLLRSLYTPKIGMYDAQKRIETAGQNIANVNTEGYSRQRVETVSDRSYNTDIEGKSESGHDTLRITRVRDSFLDSQIREENGILGEYESKAEVLSEVETAFLEPSDNGLNKAMSEMWNSWQELSKNPSEVSVKTVVTQTTENFAVTLNVIATRLDDIKSNSKDVIENEVFNLNKTLERIDSLNNQIYKSTIRNVAPNTLLDERDLLLDEVSKSINVEVSLDKFNRATVSSSGQTLVAAEPEVEVEYEVSFVDSVSKNAAGDYEVQLSLAGNTVDKPDPITVEASDYESNYSYLTEGNVVFTKKDFVVDKASIEKFDTDELTGEIKGYNDSYNNIEEYVNSLNALTNSIAQRVNAINVEEGSSSSGTESFANTGIKFFIGENADGKFTAKDIEVNSDIINNPEKINADSISGAYDGKRALAIASLRNKDFLIEEEYEATGSIAYVSGSLEFASASDGASFDDYYTNLISNVGTEKQSADRMVDNEEALIEQLDLKKESISGVSLDEEIANLVQFQNAYAANAKVMSTLVEMLDTLMNNTGL